MFVYQKIINEKSALIIQNTTEQRPINGADAVAVFVDDNGTFTYAPGTISDGEFVAGKQPASLPEITASDTGKILTAGVVDDEPQWVVGDAIKQIEIKIEPTGLPEVGESNIIYLVESSATSTGDLYDEFVWSGNAFEKLGNTVDLSGYVPTTRKINNNALSSDITLTATDVGAVSDTVTVCGKSLSGTVTISASDVGAVSNTVTINGKALEGTVTLSASDVSAQPVLISGTNIKTVQGETLLGSGNVVILPAFDPTADAGKCLQIDASTGQLVWAEVSGGSGDLDALMQEEF